MKRVDGRTLLISVLFVGVILLSLSFVSAAEGQPGILKKLYDVFFSGVFSGAGEFLNTDSVSRVLLTFLVVILVYSVSDFIPVVEEKEWIKWVFSLIVGILSFLIVDKETIIGIVTTYSALGVTLTSVIPLVILLAFHYRIVTNANYKKASPFFTKVLAKFLFLLFGLWLLFRWNEANSLDKSYVMAYLGAALFAFLWVFVGDFVAKWMSKRAKKANVKGANDEANADHVARLLVEIDDLTRAMKSASASEKARLRARITELKKLAEEVASR